MRGETGARGPHCTSNGAPIRRSQIALTVLDRLNLPYGLGRSNRSGYIAPLTNVSVGPRVT